MAQLCPSHHPTTACPRCSPAAPQITVGDPERQEPVGGIRSIPPDRWALSCCVCRQRMGAKIQCAYGDCCTAYHPLCARLAGEAPGLRCPGAAVPLQPQLAACATKGCTPSFIHELTHPPPHALLHLLSHPPQAS